MKNDEALSRYREFLKNNGNSESVINLYYKRVRTFLARRPEALAAGEEELRHIIDKYIDSMPASTGLGVTAAAVRHLWASLFDERYFKRMKLSDFPHNQTIEEEGAVFENYLRNLGRLQEDTIKTRARKVRLFLHCQYGTKGFSRDTVDADAVCRHISETMSDYASYTKAGFATSIRSYASFLESQGHSDNAKKILRLSLRSAMPHSRLPECISDGDFSALLEEACGCPERRSRDRAILLLMGNLGLRTCDVASLTLDDIDWQRGVIHVRNSKSITDRTIPLDTETGKAIEEYVLDTRPKDAGTRSLFLPSGNETPGKEIGSDQIRHRIRHLSTKAGLASYCGAHSLRRAVASNMTNNGVSIKVIADVLGHERISTTMGYLRINIARLKQACCLWPEGGRL